MDNMQNVLDAKHLIEEKLTKYFGVSSSEANVEQIYRALSLVVVDMLLDKKKTFNRQVKNNNGKRVYYLCMEYLVGRSLKNNLYNLGIVETYREALSAFGVDLETLYEQEPDAGLGNGGLGRLAACYMDALSSQNYPATGFSIRYEYGLFKQKIVDGWQTEMPDVWLPGGEIWLVPRMDRILKVRFNGHIKESFDSSGKLKFDYFDYNEIEAVPYDMLMSGAESDAVSTLRLWRARNITKFDMKSFSQGDYMKAMKEDYEAELISKILYPSDDHAEGKTLRLKQQYFLVSSSIQNIVLDHVKRYGDLHTLPDYAAIHINDTHPALSIPELMRILLDDYQFSWEDAWDVVTRTIAYTNHTILAEALETWSEDLIERKIPRIHMIIKEINRRYTASLWQRYPGDWDKIQRMSIIAFNKVRMANLSIVGSHKVNGVSTLHSDILKESVFKDQYNDEPQKFTNVTNGIAHRRWLNQSNPRISSLLDELIGHGYYKNAMELEKFKNYVDDKKVLDRLAEIKHENKVDFSNYLFKKTNVLIDPNSIFDVQAKRLHEYKRQLLNVLKIITIYNRLKENPNLVVFPETYIFAAKAAPGYYMAKKVIQLISKISKDIESFPSIKSKLNVVFIENYCVTMAEKLIPASDVSEQISLAGKEASGTGNMKFMINGAITLGTLDGANVEISQAVGKDNIFIFGMTACEVEELWRKGYNSTFFYNKNVELKKVIESLKLGFYDQEFKDISNYLLTDYGIADPYMCLADYEDYMNIYNEVQKAYLDKYRWQKMAAINIASAGIFAADRSINEYADRIWNLKKIK
jgi:starch phosphorylase